MTFHPTARAAVGLAEQSRRLYCAVVALSVMSVALALAGPGVQRMAILLVLAPLIEESAFRAGLQEALLLRWKTPLAANVMTALVFGLGHVVLRGDAAAFSVALPALLIGAAYGRWRRVRVCVVLHAGMNTLWLAWSLLGSPSIIGL
jgi:membrane protease YdiL (CAAX protease family)